MNTNNPRALKLKKQFDLLINGKQPLTRQNYLLFIEALCLEPNVAACISKVVGSPKGLDCVQSSMRIDLSPAFLNGVATDVLKYLSAPELADIGGGVYLQRVVVSIVEPPIFWDVFRMAFQAGQLQHQAECCFAWLLLQLVSLPGDQSTPYLELAEDPTITDALISSSSDDARSFAHKIKHILATRGTGAVVDLEYGPGGRHDNDFTDFRQIAILPTADELMSKEPAFLRPSDALDVVETEAERVATHLDNQFRLMREDMLYEMRDELQMSEGKIAIKKAKRRGFIMDGLRLLDVHYEFADGKKCKWGLTFQCPVDFWQFKGVKPKDRKDYAQKNPKIFRHQSMTCLLADDGVVAFPSVNRDLDLLAKTPPIIVLQVEGQKTAAHTLLKLRMANRIKLIQIDTAVFSYEPILTALQEKQDLSLSPELLSWTTESSLGSPLDQPRSVVDAIKANPGQDLQPLLKSSRSIKLDKAQADSLLAGLTQKVSLIQGPPGTGKSFIGALLAKAIHDFTSQTILVVCYTNHALDQFLEDLLDTGIPESSIVRLGGKSTPRTANLSLFKQPKNSGRNWGTGDWNEINSLRTQADILADAIVRDFAQYKAAHASADQLMMHLEFDHPEYFEAFQVPTSQDGMRRVGKGGKDIGEDYLLHQWLNNKDGGMFKNSPNVKDAREIWNKPSDQRGAELKRWQEEILKDVVDQFVDTAVRYNKTQTLIDRKFGENHAAILCSKRIIGCTTTGAAMHREIIEASKPDVLLVEEAGEIHESHVLTALSSHTDQLILIGDHKQLRPKVNNYLLSVEKGEGYDLNRSLFERLVLRNYPHTTLREQHRMRPEISELVRHLTYPDLLDAPRTKGRADLMGIRDNVVFINHDHPEDEDSQLEERRDMNAKSSKQNKFEVDLVLMIVRYLGQQGYRSDQIVILTPYLGQLRQLKDALSKTNDPVLNDLDTHDLVKAGLMSSSAAKVTKTPIRLATIDNYQGEESDIVICSLTRSNSSNDIGFMVSSERVNVLLSRARIGLILIGNMHTFMHSRKGGEVWKRLLEFLKEKGHIYDGLPTRCERHPDRLGLLKCADDFDKECPDGGCTQPCGATLSCGLHACPSKCHQLSDHSKMPCEYIIYSTCSKYHRQQYKCHKGPPASCTRCDADQKAAENRKQEEFTRQERRDADQRKHDQEMAALNDEMARKQAALRDAQLEQERKDAILQKKKDLQNMADFTAQAIHNISAAPPPAPSPPPVQSASTSSKPSSSSPQGKRSRPPPQAPTKDRANSPEPALRVAESEARKQWQRQKDMEGASNDAIDSIMEMTGLEDVKMQVLGIKDKVDTTKRQGTSLAGERFNVSMLGNPGTGKTTVARHYGAFLASVQVIPGNMFIETTGSRLANDGVPGAKKTIETLINAGGGTIFVDEAYQLTSGQNYGGGQVLDFLLAEMENNVGKIVFIFAGYNKEMEKFFEHNPGLMSRVPYTLQFKDYEDPELLSMLETMVEKKWRGKMCIEEGVEGLYGRIVVRRLGRGRGRPGFGNARSLQIMFSKICERQAIRLSKERRKGMRPDDFLITKEDLIGPDPSRVMAESKAWKKMQTMIGLTAVKKTIANFFFSVDTNYHRELQEKAPMQVSLNRVFLGSPGTGKTTVAKLYGQILADLGLISNGEVVVKNPADFIGSALGQSESQTKAILATTVGKVLIIDEAYMLYGGSGNAGGVSDPYKTAVMDTIVAEVQSVPGEDRCVLLLGYRSQIEDMFQNVNPGLARRFAIENAFHFHDYSDSELMQALEWKLKDQELCATDAGKNVALQVLSRLRNRPNFGNIGEVENLLSQAKNRWQERQSNLPIHLRAADAPFEPQDFDPDFERGKTAATNLSKLFEDVVGCDDIVAKLAGWQRMTQNLKNKGKDPRQTVPTTFIFKGPPGTGKTTTARKIGSVFYDMGFLSSTEVIECSASDLVGSYVGQTGPKTKKMFEKALGRVLFVDEAYRLSEGHFAKEAMDEIVGILTQEAFKGKLIVVLAGYDREMDDLMRVNPGLSSRFPTEIIFRNMPPDHCLEVLRRKLLKDNIHVDGLDDQASTDYLHMQDLLQELSSLPSFGNARDMETLSKQMMEVVFSAPSSEDSAEDNSSEFRLTADRAIACIEAMLSGRRSRTARPSSPALLQPLPQLTPGPQDPPIPPTIRTAQSIKQETAPPPPRVDAQSTASDGRDPGVSDEEWRQLLEAKHAAEEEEKRTIQRMRLLEKERQEAEERKERAKAEAERLKLAAAKAKDDAERAELMRKREQERIKAAKAREEQEKRRVALEEEDRKRKEEAQVQTKLRSMGVCPMGYRWIKQAHGYRCGGGSHFVDNASLGL